MWVLCLGARRSDGKEKKENMKTNIRNKQKWKNTRSDNSVP